ncbi:MAG: Gfo/Idh/MocA family oxidoreductase [Oenococcus sp.]|uniref:Gfo/Idh/MocA family protein n=1 Tax=Oenococcus sp. TaxID=1979414 RepID=UPI0039ED8B36
MTAVTRIKTAIIGCGAISDIYLQNMTSRFQILDLVACSDRHQDRADAKAAKYGIKSMTIDDVFADPDIQLIVNLTPPLAHYEMVKRAILANKNVYTEKVLAVTYAQAKELIALARDHHVLIGSAPDTFLGAGIQSGKRAVDEGLIGQVTSVHVAVNRDMRHLYNPHSFTGKTGGGIGFDVGVYYLTALLSILGPVAEVGGLAENFHPDHTIEDPASPLFGDKFTVENENMMVGYLRFKNNVLGTLHFNSDAIWPEQPAVVLYGREGILALPDPNRFDGQVRLYEKGALNPIEIPQNFGYAKNARGLGAADLAWSIVNHRQPRASAEMAAHAVEILNGILAATKSGQRQTMTSDFVIPKAMPIGYLGDYFGRSEEAALALKEE